MAMRTEKRTWTSADGWQTLRGGGDLSRAQLVLWFGSGSALDNRGQMQMLREWYPDASVIGCSTAGEIAGTSVLDDSIVATAMHFEHTRLRTTVESLRNAAESERSESASRERLPATTSRMCWCSRRAFISMARSCWLDCVGCSQRT